MTTMINKGDWSKLTGHSMRRLWTPKLEALPGAFVVALFLWLSVGFSGETLAAESASSASIATFSRAAAGTLASQRISGGVQAPAGAWPWMVAIYEPYGTNNQYMQVCGGTLIRSNWVLTAAHCVTDNNGNTIATSTIYVVIGRSTLTSTGGQQISVKQIIVNPTYNSVIAENDIALVELSTSASSSYTPVTLIGPSFDNSLMPDGTILTGLGWGATPSSNGTDSNVLMQASSIQVVNQATCQAGLFQIDPTFIVTNNMFCAIGNVSGVVEDTCTGDSGGPLVYQAGSDGHWVESGITDWGPSDSCGGSIYGVYVRLSNYAYWIEQNTCSISDVPQAPQLNISVSGLTVTASWNAVPNAKGYRLYYAPYPFDPFLSPQIYNVDVGSQLSMSYTFPGKGASYYVAVHAYNQTCYGNWSNVVPFTMQ